MATNQKALRLLGAHSDCSFGMRFLNDNTGKAHTPSSVSKLLAVPRPAVCQWKEKCREIMEVPAHAAKKEKLKK